ICRSGFSGWRGVNRFLPRDAFGATDVYALLPFRFCDFDGAKLLVNDAGDHAVISNHDFADLVAHRLPPSSDAYLELAGKQFITEKSRDTATALAAMKIRTRKSFLAGFTKLHIFVVSLRCEHS